MNNFIVQIANPDVFHRWVSVNAPTEDVARAMIAKQFPGYVIEQVIDKGPV